MTYYGPDALRPYAMAFWHTSEWLEGPWSKLDQDAFDFLYDLNILGYTPFKNEFEKIQAEKNWDFYSNRYGLTYSDIKDPIKFHNNFGAMSGSRQFYNSLNFVSSNVKRLYR